MRIAADQQIYLEEVPVAEIAATYGTPTYVYEENRIRSNFRRVLGAFRKHYDNFHLFYAIKANSNPAIAHLLRQEGAGIDAASVNEILLAKRLGLDGRRVVFSGNFLSDEDIRQGLASGVIFNLDDAAILPRLLAFGTPELLSFRVNPGYGKSNVGHYVTNAGPNAKFGVHPDQVLGAYRQARDAGVRHFGAHMMPGSCMQDPEYFVYITELLLDIIGKTGRELKIDFEFVDLGGGLGIPYRPGDQVLDIERTARLVVHAFKAKCQQYGLKPPQLAMEPARYFVGDAGFIVGRVQAIKRSYCEIVGTDIGMNVLVRPAMYGAYHGIFVNGREQEPRQPLGLCGQICENTDFWVRDRELPAGTAEGDLIVVENAGAYGFGMSYQYNGRLRAAEVLVNGKQHHLIRHRETFADMVRHTEVPAHLQA